MTGFGTAVFWFSLCVLLAGLEVEAEGDAGWARKMPTWYRTSGPVARLYGLVMGKKPLTGYHAFMFFVPLMIVHVPATVMPWSLADELRALSVFFLVNVAWDFLWFVMNPAFGLRKFRPEHVWWHANEPWLLGAPRCYWVGLLLSLGFGVAREYLIGNGALWECFTLLVRIAAFTTVACMLGPTYRRWRRRMNRRDDRPTVRRGTSLEESLDGR